MSDGARDMLVRGIAAAKDNAFGDAQRYLERMLYLQPTYEQEVEALTWLGRVVSDPDEKREYLEAALTLDSTYPAARREWAILNGNLRREEIIDPDRLAKDYNEVHAALKAKQMLCPGCGGQLAFAPDGKTLACDHCGSNHPLGVVSPPGLALDERDFTVASATSRGHASPEGTRELECRSCGASFVTSSDRLNFTCPHCASVYVEEEAEDGVRYPPDGIIPFQIPAERAVHLARRWLKREYRSRFHLLDELSGIYFPVWTFDVGGEAVWRVESRMTDQQELPRGVHRVLENDVLQPAGHGLPEALLAELEGFDLNLLVPYDPRYVADWPVERYCISVTDASLEARKVALERARASMRAGLPHGYSASAIRVSSARLVVDSFKLILVPLWIGRYGGAAESYSLVVNGQKGGVRAEQPARGLRKLWNWLTDDVDGA